MRDTILYDSAMRLFGDHVSPQVLAAADTGTPSGGADITAVPTGGGGIGIGTGGGAMTGSMIRLRAGS